MLLKMVGRHLAYFLLLLIMLALMVQGSSDKSAVCSDFDGVCMPASESSICYTKANLGGCDDDEFCCLSPSSSIGRQADQCDPTPARCKDLFNGKCLDECPDDRIAVETCQENCTCCGCRIKDDCKNNHGFCTLKWKRCEGVKENSWCNGKRCTCCVPDCPETANCTEAGGYCNKSCGEKESPHQTIKCINSDKNGCQCCVPDCPETDDCTEAGGYCDKSCGEKERPHRTIKCINSDNGCQCCVPECANSTSCLSVDGRCDKKCLPDELVNFKARCEGFRCRCCVKAQCPQSEECRSVRGKCRGACRFPFEETSSQAKCDGEGCACCVLKILTIKPCKQCQECHEMGGKCRRKCFLGSTLNAACPDSGCKCCKRIFPFKGLEPKYP